MKRIWRIDWEWGGSTREYGISLKFKLNWTLTLSLGKRFTEWKLISQTSYNKLKIERENWIEVKKHARS